MFESRNVGDVSLILGINLLRKESGIPCIRIIQVFLVIHGWRRPGKLESIRSSKVESS